MVFMIIFNKNCPFFLVFTLFRLIKRWILSYFSYLKVIKSYWKYIFLNKAHFCLSEYKFITLINGPSLRFFCSKSSFQKIFKFYIKNINTTVFTNDKFILIKELLSFKTAKSVFFKENISEIPKITSSFIHITW